MRQPPTPRTWFRGPVGGHGPHSPLLCDPLLQLGQEEVPVETVDGRDVRENARGDFWRDPRFCQLAAEDLRSHREAHNGHREPARHLP